MSLPEGTRLGPYQITAAIGAGGMGEVYRARDTRLNRDVAIKVLPPVFAADPGRLARFEREAQTLAALNHPHIAHIHGVIGPAESAPHALVMEFVDGEDLAARLKRGPLPLDEALSVTQQIADALEAAHERGVIHRDLKPANVKVTPEGSVKVLDFGLAKATESSSGILSGPLSDSPTVTSPAVTRLGVILGTAGYMAPEQAKGKPVDRRADIWALGVVLFEMLTGKMLYLGETVTETIAQVITQPANLEALPAQTPASVRRILRRCLEKDPRNRFQSAGDIRIEIDEVLSGSSGDATHVAPQLPRRSVWQWIPAAVAMAAVGALLFVAKPWQRREATAEPSMLLDVRIDESHRLHVDENIDGAVAVISPDGKTLAYIGVRDAVRRLYVRRIDSDQATPLAGTEGALNHFFSPDSQWIGFFTMDALKKVPLAGGAPITILPTVDARGAAWGSNDVIVFTPTTNSGLHRVPASGAREAEVVTTLAERERTHRWPAFLPDGKTVIYMVQAHDSAYDDGVIEAVNLDTKKRTVLLRGGTYPRYLAGGILTYVRNSTLFAVGFDSASLQVTGKPQPVLSDIMESRGTGAGTGNGAAQISFSNTGVAVMLTGQAGGAQSEMVITDREGKTIVAAPDRREFRSPAMSPDGNRVAVQIFEGTGSHIHVFDIARKTLSKVTFDGSVNGAPAWSHDGRRVAFFSDRAGTSLNVVTTRSDGGGEAETITSNPYINVPTSFSHDGARLATMEQGREANGSYGMDIMIWSLKDKKVTPFLATRAAEMLARFSPDSRWLAYQSDESGKPEVYVRPFPGPGGKWMVSSGGGGNPTWTKGGREIVYAGGSASDEFYAVDISVTGDTIAAGTPVKLFSAAVAHPPNAWWHDVSPDGARFVVLKVDDTQRAAGHTHVRMITNILQRIRRTE